MKKLSVNLVSGIGQHHTNEYDPKKPNRPLVPYLTIVWADVRALVDTPQQVDKTAAQWLIPSNHPSRKFKEQEEKGEYWMLWADLDKNPPALSVISLYVDEILGSYDFEAYNSRSATQENPKARVLIPLAAPLRFADWELAQAILNDQLAALGVTPDRANERAAQLCYLPNKGAFYSSKSRREGQYFDPMQSWAQEIAKKRQEIEADRLELEAIQQQTMAKKAALTLPNGNRESSPQKDFIELKNAFNEVYTPHEWMLSAGYSQRGNTFRHPHSESGSYSAACQINDKGELRVNALSLKDLLHTGKGGHDAFGTYCTLFHGGDNAAAAIAAGKDLLTIGSVSWNKAKQREWAKRQQDQKNNNSTSGNGTTGQQDETKAKKESSFSAKWLDGDALADSAEAPYFIINNILEADSHGLMIGASESFKTFCALKMAHCITTGNDFFGHSVFTPGKVLYICGEGKGALKRRIRALKQVEGGFNNNLHVLAAPLLIDDKTAMAWLSAQVKAIKPLLVISDTFSSLTTITNENDNSDVAKTLQLMKDTCSDGKTVSLVIHHLGKDATKGTRGASAFNANTDFRLEMVRSAGSMLTTLSSGKTKDSDNFDDIQMMAHVVELPLIRQDGRATTSLILKPTDEQPKATRSGLSARDDAILQTLNDAIATHGVEPGTEIKAKFAGFDSYEGKLKQVVHIDHWRELAYKTITIDDVVKDKSQALRKAFKRCRDKLFDTGYIVEHGDYVWRIFDEKRT